MKKALCHTAVLGLVFALLIPSCGGGSGLSLEEAWSEDASCSPFEDIAVYGDYLYAAAGQAGIYIYSIQDPDEPKRLGSFYYNASADAGYGQSEGYTGLAVALKPASGDLASQAILVASSSKGLDQISLADPEAPVGLGYALGNSGQFPFSKVRASGPIAVACPSPPDQDNPLKTLVGGYSLATGLWAGGRVNYNQACVRVFQGVDAAALSLGDRSYACALVKKMDSTGSTVATPGLGPILYIVDLTSGLRDDEGTLLDYPVTLANDGSSKGFVAASSGTLAVLACGKIYKASVSQSQAEDAYHGMTATVDGIECDSADALGLAVDGGIAYVLYEKSLDLYDLASSPSLKASMAISLPEGHKAFTVRDGRVYTGGSEGLVAYKIKGQL